MVGEFACRVKQGKHGTQIPCAVLAETCPQREAHPHAVLAETCHPLSQGVGLVDPLGQIEADERENILGHAVSCERRLATGQQ